MEILHVTDLHFNQHWFEWIANQQNNFDVFCLSGDFLEPASDVALSSQIEWISGWMKNFQKPLFVCSGNHDIEEEENEEWLNKVSNIYSDNTITTLDGVKFGCVPYIGGDFLEFCDCDILLSHVPPAKTDTSTDKKNQDWGDRELLRLLKSKLLAPKYLLCGHMHNPINIKTTLHGTIISNPGSNAKQKIPLHNILVLKQIPLFTPNTPQ